jgi:hypothetical protein
LLGSHDVRHLFTLQLGFILGTWCAPALADGGRQPARSTFQGEPADAVPEERRWYGTPMLVADATALAAFGVAPHLEGTNAPTALVVSGLAAYVVVSPVVHLLHDHGDRALGSLALRLGLPILGAMMGIPLGGSCHTDDDSCVSRGLYYGTLIGLGTAAIVDQLMAFDRRERPARSHGLSVAPTLAIGGGGGSLGLAGAF